MKQDEVRVIHYIPENYTTGINVLGMNFKVRNFVEGIILAIIFAILSALFFFNIAFFEFGTKVGLVISFALMGFVLGVIGFNDEPVSVFLLNKLNFDNKKRTAFYNPRVKDETIPYFYQYQERQNNLPREKIIAFYKKYKADIERKEQERMSEFQKTNTFDETSMFFKDDEGIVAKPVEYMSSSEYKKYQKDLKRHARKLAKEEKRQLKLKRKEEKEAEKQAKKQGKGV